MKFLRAIVSEWTWRMAWRDSRSSRMKLLLFSSSIIIGIAALVAIGSFGENLRDAIDEQAKALLGADLVLASRDPFTPEADRLIREIGGRQAREISFSSMAQFPKTGGTRLVQIRALERGFPFYGTFETSPPEAAANFHSGSALVQETLLLQFNSQPGDTVKVGRTQFPIAGALRKVPGENAVFSTIAPRIYIPFDQLERTGLMGRENLARFKVYFKLPVSTDVEALLRKLRPRLEKLNLGAETVAERKASLGRALENLNRFLSLGGFVALLLGAIGIASAIHVHVRQKTASLTVLRCLGCSVAQTFAIYLIQAAALGVIGAAAGCLLGLAVQQMLPRIAADVLPFQITPVIAWSAVGRALASGLVVCVVFALLPLLAVRRVSPLAVLRASLEPARIPRDPAHWLVMSLAAAVLIYLAWREAGNWRRALGFTGGLAGAFLLLTLFAQLLRSLARLIVLRRGQSLVFTLPFVWRQGMANLYRPQNRTLLLLLSLGLGVFLMLTLVRTSQILSTGLLSSTQADQPNAALFDVQQDQVEKLESILRERNLPVLADVPIVTMRLASVKGEPLRKLLRDPSRHIPRWVLRREYRCTWRDTLDSSEELVQGAWPPKMQTPGINPVSVEEEIAKDLKLAPGDRFVFDLQGVLLTNEVAAIRKVDWKRIQPNFFVVFPSGVLEDAPGFHIITTRTPDRQASAEMQRAVVQALPNVSIIDLALVLDTIDAVLSKVGFVFRFMALFTLATGAVVLVASVLTGRYQRIQETVLLRTLGASRRQVYWILITEYFFLGLLAALAGVILAEAGSWALARYVFDAKFQAALAPAAITLAGVTLATVLTGLIANRGVLGSPPLDVLRPGANG